jgi:hypothetical protein
MSGLPASTGPAAAEAPSAKAAKTTASAAETAPTAAEAPVTAAPDDERSACPAPAFAPLATSTASAAAHSIHKEVQDDQQDEPGSQVEAPVVLMLGFSLGCLKLTAGGSDERVGRAVEPRVECALPKGWPHDVAHDAAGNGVWDGAF